MGSSCCNTGPSYRVENGGTIVLTGFWYEQGGPQWLDLDGGSGNFIGYEDNISVPSWGSLTNSVPSLTANNFTGNLTIANSYIQNGYLNLAGSTAANVLLLADGFNSLVPPPVIANTNTNTDTQAATIYPTWMYGSTGYTIPDEISPGTSRNTLLVPVPAACGQRGRVRAGAGQGHGPRRCEMHRRSERGLRALYPVHILGGTSGESGDGVSSCRQRQGDGRTVSGCRGAVRVHRRRIEYVEERALGGVVESAPGDVGRSGAAICDRYAAGLPDWDVGRGAGGVSGSAEDSRTSSVSIEFSA